MHVSVLGAVERCQVCLCCICMLLYQVLLKDAKYACDVYAHYCARCSWVPSVPELYMHVSVLGTVERCQVCLADICILLC
jgi:hypothetical protein